MELLTKCLMSIVTVSIAIDDHGSDHMPHWNYLEFSFIALLFPVIINQTSELWNNRWNVNRYLCHSLNRMILFRSMLGIIWLSMRFYSSCFTVSRLLIGLQSVLDVLELIRYISQHVSLRKFLIISRAMVIDLTYPLLLYMTSLAGFIICLLGLVYIDVTDNSSNAFSVLAPESISTTFAFRQFNNGLNAVGLILMLNIIGFSFVLFIIRFRAEMIYSYHKAADV